MIVADTSLIVHLFNQTPLTTTAQKVLAKESHWIMPLLWQEEYANVLSKLARKEHRGVESVMDHFVYTITELKDNEMAVDNKKALRVALEFSISVYDAHFVVLAKDYDTLLVTEDKELIKKCPRIAISMHAFLKL